MCTRLTLAVHFPVLSLYEYTPYEPSTNRTSHLFSLDFTLLYLYPRVRNVEHAIDSIYTTPHEPDHGDKGKSSATTTFRVRKKILASICDEQNAVN